MKGYRSTLVNRIWVARSIYPFCISVWIYLFYSRK